MLPIMVKIVNITLFEKISEGPNDLSGGNALWY
jgi:hypothetical protein